MMAQRASVVRLKEDLQAVKSATTVRVSIIIEQYNRTAVSWAVVLWRFPSSCVKMM
jgi:hypothetical protein